MTTHEIREGLMDEDGKEITHVRVLDDWYEIEGLICPECQNLVAVHVDVLGEALWRARCLRDHEWDYYPKKLAADDDRRPVHHRNVDDEG